ncbi:MAG: methionyl-tRNA formyltransferase, partial [Coprobacillus sp.]
TTYLGKVVKIWEGKVHSCENAIKHHAHQDNGTIVKIFKDAIGVKVNDGVFLITEFQLEGKKRMSVKDYLNGHNIFEIDTKFE